MATLSLEDAALAYATATGGTTLTAPGSLEEAALVYAAAAPAGAPAQSPSAFAPAPSGQTIPLLSFSTAGVPAWVTLTLEDAGASATPTNVAALQLWAQSEGMPASSNNPLAASDKIAGWKPTPGFTEPSYPSPAAAAALYASKFKSEIFGAIEAAFKLGDNLNAIYQAINQSPWCSGCQGGHYPIAIYRQLGGTGTGGATAGQVGVVPTEALKGYDDLRLVLAQRLPSALQRSERLGVATLRALSSARKVRL